MRKQFFIFLLIMVLGLIFSCSGAARVDALGKEGCYCKLDTNKPSTWFELNETDCANTTGCTWQGPKSKPCTPVDGIEGQASLDCLTGQVCLKNICVNKSSPQATAAASAANPATASGASSAASSAGGLQRLNVSGVDERCWTLDDCQKERTRIGITVADNTNEKALYQGTDAVAACGGTENKDIPPQKVGFCSPISQATTEVNFYGKTSFNGIGDFLQYTYKLVIILAGVLAVIMIIIGGIEWMTSGGSPDRITQGRKRIGGAIVGLILAVTSYMILYQINPYMVNLRPPQAWLINPQAFVPAVCDDIDTNLAFAYKGDEQPKQDALTQLYGKVGKDDYKVKSKTGACGNYYFPQGANAPRVCAGTDCTWNGEANVCAPGVAFDSKNDGCKDNTNLLLKLHVVSFEQQLAGGRTFLGCFANVIKAKDGAWLLPLPGPDNASLLAVCRQGDAWNIEGEWEHWSFVNDIGKGKEHGFWHPKKEPNATFYNYFIGFGGLASVNSENLAYTESKWCGDNKLIGFFVYFKLNIACEVGGDRFWVGCSTPECKTAVVGSFCDQVNWQNYIPLAKLQKGLVLDVPVGEAAINSIIKNGSTWLQNTSVNGKCITKENEPKT